MHILKSEQRRAFAVLEYVMLVLILAAGLVGFRVYIERGFQGQHRKAGESIGFLRQYNPGASRDCAFDPASGVWYEVGCYNNEVLRRDCKHRSTLGSSYDSCLNEARRACTRGCTS